MELEDFLNRIHSQVSAGIKVLIPRRRTDILEVRDSGDIVYLIAGAYRKTLSRGELVSVYDRLAEGPLKTSELRRIVTPSRTCNVSTIKWILEHCGLAAEAPDRTWVRTW